MTERWTWSVMKSKYLYALNTAFFVAWLELPYAYTPFLHGLTAGVALAFLAESIRQRSGMGIVLAALGALSLIGVGPRVHGSTLWMAHVLAACFLVSFAVLLLRRHPPAPQASAA